jgi:glycosyltransferase involved in cell wall biosynthesis
MKKIKIIYTIPNFDTCATGYAMLKLITNLNKEEFEPLIVCLHDRGKLFELVKDSGIPYYIYPYLSPLKPRYILLFKCIKVALFFKRLKPDLIFSYHYSSDFSEALSAKLAGAKFLYIKKNMGWRGPSYKQWRIKTWLADAITVQNTDMMKEFFSNNPKASIISLGVDTQEYFPRPKNINLMLEFGINEQYKVILCVANIIPKKGIDFLIKGFATSSSKNNSILLIVGDDQSELGTHLHALKNELGVADNVIFTGKRFDVKEILSLADLFILPSTGNEGAPVAIQEAMASGIVVVTTDTPGNRDQLNELPKQLIPPVDEKSIASAIDHFLYISEKERRFIIDKQIQIIKNRYSLTEEIRKHELLYRQLMRR